MGRDDDDRADDPTTPAASETSEDAPTEEEDSEEPAAEPDRSTPGPVVNAGGINGMAGAWRHDLEGEGREDVSVTTADNVQQEPVVRYRHAADADRARAHAEQVGVDEVRQSGEYEARITFVAVAEPGDEGGDEGGEEGEG